jgi:hypothetical protein
LRSPAGRITNQTLLIALVLVFGTGVATVAIGSASGRWAAIAHGIAGLVILLLVPWKSRVVKGGLRRGRHTRWVSLVLTALVVITFVAGLGYATGLVVAGPAHEMDWSAGPRSVRVRLAVRRRGSLPVVSVMRRSPEPRMNA